MMMNPATQHAVPVQPPSKSTPLSSLPAFQQQSQQQQQQQQSSQHGGGHDPSMMVVNDPHRRIIAQAQQAAQNYTLPQSSTHDVYEDDATIQEALADMRQGGGGPMPGGQQGMGMAHSMPPTQLPPSMMHSHAGGGLASHLDYSGLLGEPLLYGGPGPSGAQDVGAPQQAGVRAASAQALRGMFDGLMEDLWVVGAAVVGLIVAALLPLEALVAGIPALTRVPHSVFLVRAIIVGGAVFMALRTRALIL